MSITDELRLFAADPYTSWVPTDKQQADLRAIADRIDAEHDQMHDFCKRLESAVTDREDVTLWGVDYIALPIDADGEAWHVGDLAVGEVNPNNPKEVERMLWYGPDSGWQLETRTIIFPCPERVRHYHAPTVEDVPREFAEKMNENMGMYTSEAIDAEEWRDADTKTVEQYAAKLQLREGRMSKLEPTECTLTVEHTETLGDATTERRAELNGYLSKEVLESALAMMRKVVDA